MYNAIYHDMVCEIKSVGNREANTHTQQNKLRQQVFVIINENRHPGRNCKHINQKKNNYASVHFVTPACPLPRARLAPDVRILPLASRLYLLIFTKSSPICSFHFCVAIIFCIPSFHNQLVWSHRVSPRHRFNFDSPSFSPPSQQ